MAISERDISEMEQKSLLNTEREQRLLAETLTEVTLALTSQMHITTVLNEILRQARRIVPYQTAHIVLLENDNLRIACWQGYEDFGSEHLIADLVQPLSEFPLDAEVVQSRQPLLIPDTHNETRWVVQTETTWVRAHVVFPIILGETVLGLLRLDSDSVGAFSEKTIRYLHPLMNAAAIALENARLFEQAQKELADRLAADARLKEKVDELEMNYRQTTVFAEELRGEVLERKRIAKQIKQRNKELSLLNRVISTAARGLREEAILDYACRELALAFDVGESIAFLFEKEHNSNVLRTVATYLKPKTLDIDTDSLANCELIEILSENKVPVVIKNLEADTRISDQSWLRQRQVTSLVALPLLIDERVEGCISLLNVQADNIASSEINLMWRVADQVSIAIARTRADKQRRQLSAAIEQSAEGVVITDAKGTIVYINSAFSIVFGNSNEPTLGKSYSHLLQTNIQASSEILKDIYQKLQSGDFWEGRLSGKKFNGKPITLNVSIAPIRNRHNEVTNYAVSLRDITKELQLENQYRQAEKMNAIGRLTSGITHDFNNLLTAINGFAETLQVKFDPDDERREYVDNIRYTGQRAADLISRLMTFSRKEVTNAQVIDLNKVVLNITKMLSPILGSNIQLSTVFAQNLWRVKIDPSQLEQIVVNLAVNAKDAMPNGGKLNIHTTNVHLKNLPVFNQTTDSIDGDFVLLSVSDNGEGMPEEVKAHIFEPFFTTKGKGKGSGLGLATIFGIVQQSHGHIEVESEPGKGTEFKIYLPRSVQKMAETPKPTRASDLPHGNETVLVVEDETSVRTLAVRLLERYGYTVIEAEDGLDALAVLKDFKGTLDLLLVDMIMPNLSGQDLAHQLRARYATLKTLFMSGQLPSQQKNSGSEISNFIRKPFSAFDLIKRVRDVLDTEI